MTPKDVHRISKILEIRDVLSRMSFEQNVYFHLGCMPGKGPGYSGFLNTCANHDPLINNALPQMAGRRIQQLVIDMIAKIDMVLSGYGVEVKS